MYDAVIVDARCAGSPTAMLLAPTENVGRIKAAAKPVEFHA